MSRKLRPLSGRFSTSAWDTVPAIWLRAASSTIAGALTVTDAATDSSGQGDGHFERRAERERQLARRIWNPARRTVISYAPDPQVGEAESPRSVASSRRR